MVLKTDWFTILSSSRDKIESLLAELKIHDVGTYNHCQRVGSASKQLAKHLGLGLLEQNIVYYSGLLHDVGKLKIPVDIINKPSRLNSEEYDLMKKHTLFGVELIEPFVNNRFFEQVSRAIRYHHERIDGNGYFQLSSQEIPLASKIILIVDTVDAMTQDRAYRKGLPMSVAIDELIQCSGTQFDQNIVDVYLENMTDVTDSKIIKAS